MRRGQQLRGWPARQGADVDLLRLRGKDHDATVFGAQGGQLPFGTLGRAGKEVDGAALCRQQQALGAGICLTGRVRRARRIRRALDVGHVDGVQGRPQHGIQDGGHFVGIGIVARGIDPDLVRAHVGRLTLDQGRGAPPVAVGHAVAGGGIVAQGQVVERPGAPAPRDHHGDEPQPEQHPQSGGTHGSRGARLLDPGPQAVQADGHGHQARGVDHAQPGGRAAGG